MGKRLLSIDPGKMTGVAEWDTSDLTDPKLLETHELEQMPLGAYVKGKLRSGHDYDIVMERYIIGDADAPWSLEVIGNVRFLYWEQTGRDYIELQAPADAKAFADNDRLRALGFWHRGGAGHANDAIRHGILYMVREYFWHSPKLL